MANRLGDATSPYLLQHADNPVDWWPWCDEAFDEARRRDVPVLLSVGYAACHWCHVMAHESFEDADVARVMNDGFVAVKVDREERPDVDSVYMTATTALTGRGGWPMTCLLTPDGRPFYAGTYFPRTQFLQLLAALGDAWTNRRAEVEESADRIHDALVQLQRREEGAGDEAASHLAQARLDAAGAAPGVPFDAAELDAAEERIADEMDWSAGGLAGAPKFPPSMVLEWLLRHHAGTGTPRALQAVETTCEAMARGGIYDQLEGGFARYSVDAGWVVPHFEKMLYDNAQLLAVYAHLARATGSSLARRVASETADFLLRRLRTDEGAFASALDADTPVDGRGVEGYTYVWTQAELAEVLGEADGLEAAALLHVTDSGTFERGASTLQLRDDPPDPAWWAGVRERLASARARRPQPARDDKVVTSWNGLAIGGLADAGLVLDRPDLVDAARRCADVVLGTHLVDGRLRRTSRAGVVGPAAAVADDHGDLAAGLLALHAATGETRWFEAAGALLETALASFRAADGGFHDTADDAESLVLRPRTGTDNAEPGGQSAVAGALLTYGALAGSPRHLDAAREALGRARPIVEAQPRFAGWSLAAAEAFLAGPLQVAIVHGEDAPDDDARALLEAARAATSPGLVLAHGRPDTPGVPLLADRPLVDGRAAAYVCRGFVCDAPVTNADDLRAALGTP